MTEYVLDLNKWRCGGSGVHKLGEGDTLLLNREDYSCCLGQFALQKGVPEGCLKGCAEPVDILEDYHNIGAYDAAFLEDTGDGRIYSTGLTMGLIAINDEEDTTVESKIINMTLLLEEHGHTLKVVQ